MDIVLFDTYWKIYISSGTLKNTLKKYTYKYCKKYCSRKGWLRNLGRLRIKYNKVECAFRVFLNFKQAKIENISHIVFSAHPCISDPYVVQEFGTSINPNLGTRQYYPVPTNSYNTVTCVVHGNTYSVQYIPGQGIIFTFPPPSYLYIQD